ncbi:hypothetical protein Ocin01_18530 [Orchesella cincta]|uniref:Uncharacterized protein n=1 Tax=Orchesella cincta TaxID=48709 RepID=A0A1D2M5G3_ORCCI|nr:hypothetical protein Ocin01_18530 [Orchesella cincta]
MEKPPMSAELGIMNNSF